MDSARFVKLGLLFALGVVAVVGGQAQEPDLEMLLVGARTHLDAAAYAEAEGVAAEALAISEERYGSDSLQAARCLDLLARSLIARRAEIERALELTERSVRTREQHLESDDLELAEALWVRGLALNAVRKMDEAEAVLERALGILDNHDDDAATVRVLWSLTRVESDAGRFADAEIHARRQAELIEKLHGDSDPELARTLYTLARTTLRVHGSLAALPIYARAVEVGERALAPDDPSRAWLLNGLAIAQEDVGDLIAARGNYEKALALSRSELGPDHPMTTSCMNNLGTLLTRLGDLREALRYYEDVARIERGRSETDTIATARTLARIAKLYHLSGDLVRAELHYREAFKITENDPEHEAREVEVGRWRLAVLLTDLGRLEEAELEFERALAIVSEIFDSDHDLYTRILPARGRLLAKSGRWDEALEDFDRALSLVDKSFGRANLMVAAILYDRSIALAATGRKSEVLNDALAAERIAVAHVWDTATGLPERQALGFSATAARGLDVGLSVLAVDPAAGSAADLWDSTVRSRAIVLDVNAARSRATFGAVDAEGIKLVDEYTVATRRLANLSIRGAAPGASETYRVKLELARSEKERIERDLATRDRQFGNLQRLADLGLEEIRGGLGPRSALVAFVVFDKHGWLESASGEVSLVGPSSHYAAWVATARDLPRLVFLGEAGRINSLVSNWSQEASSVTGSDPAVAETSYREAGLRLRDAIWDPLAVDPDGIDDLFLVPDGALHLVNFAALPDSEGGYVVETGPVFHVLTAERDLVPRSGSARVGRGILVVGGVEFGAVDDTRGKTASVFRGSCVSPTEFKTVQFSDLPGTALESAAVSAAWQKRPTRLNENDRDLLVLLTRSAATEARVKRDAQGKRILHFATHGFFLGSGCAGGGDAGRGIGGLTRMKPTVELSPAPDALHLAGLALAGSNRRQAVSPEEEDGVLTAAEIAALDLSGTELAVLSACDTGAGMIAAGEGVLGLRRSLQIAGVGNSVISLWSVDDAATQRWMKGFYDAYLIEARTPAESVRAATRQWIAEERGEGRTTHPFYWASWIAVGP